ncbi:MAG TPA: DUF3179 domain-containing (seleno)protein [Flavitalea sp.]|nr:DUF3179 domain-containing (seleno)protein [Flavitalea sp.]
MKGVLLFIGVILLFAVEILRVYLIMPFPGSQHNNTISLAYWLGKNIYWIRIVGLIMAAVPVIRIINEGRLRTRIILAVTTLLYVTIFFFINFHFEADKMFYQPKHKVFARVHSDTTKRSKLVIGVALNDEAKAYPVELIGYHHQVRDTIGNTPVMITYCTVCRTGRVFSPFVNGKAETFRLVGMDHFNAMFEDAGTKSWWQQATGLAVAGPLKGSALKEIPSTQLPLSAWIRNYPQSLVMQPDTLFKKDYSDLAGYDKGTINSDLEKRDSLSWKNKSWVIGVLNGSDAKAYDWNDLSEKRIIQDSLRGMPVLLLMENDSVSFHVYKREADGKTLEFEEIDNDQLIKDKQTGSVWNVDGVCIQGSLAGTRLQRIPSYNEFWHSWRTFHPLTTKYVKRI